MFEDFFPSVDIAPNAYAIFPLPAFVKTEFNPVVSLEEWSTDGTTLAKDIRFVRNTYSYGTHSTFINVNYQYGT